MYLICSIFHSNRELEKGYYEQTYTLLELRLGADFTINV